MTRPCFGKFLGKVALALLSMLAATSPLMAQEHGRLPSCALPLAFIIPPGPLMGMVAAAVLLGLLIWGIKQPLAWVVVSILALGGGLVAATYGGVMYYVAQEPLGRRDVEELVIFFAFGVGASIAGVILLVIALLRNRKNRACA